MKRAGFSEADTVFLNKAVADLEEYGVSLRTVNVIERYFGIWIRDMMYVSWDKLRATPQLGSDGAEELRYALAAAYKATKDQVQDGIDQV